jgi:hypothetical protein
MANPPRRRTRRPAARASALICPALGAVAPAVAPNDPRITPVVLACRMARPAVVNISAERVVRWVLFDNDPLEDISPRDSIQIGILRGNVQTLVTIRPAGGAGGSQP